MTWVLRPCGATVEVRREKGRDFLNLWAKETDLSRSDTWSHANLLRGQKCLLWKETRSTPGNKFPSTSFSHLNSNNLFLGFPRWLRGKESTCQWRRCRRHKFDPWVGKIPGGGNRNPFQCSCLGNPWTARPGRLQSLVSQRVGHDWVNENLFLRRGITGAWTELFPFFQDIFEFNSPHMEQFFQTAPFVAW